MTIGKGHSVEVTLRWVGWGGHTWTWRLATARRGPFRRRRPRVGPSLVWRAGHSSEFCWTTNSCACPCPVGGRPLWSTSAHTRGECLRGYASLLPCSPLLEATFGSALPRCEAAWGRICSPPALMCPACSTKRVLVGSVAATCRHTHTNPTPLRARPASKHRSRDSWRATCSAIRTLFGIPPLWSLSGKMRAARSCPAEHL